MTPYLSLTVTAKSKIEDNLFGEKLKEAVGRNSLPNLSALANTFFDQKDDPQSLKDAATRAIVSEMIGKSKVVYFIYFESVEAYVFGGNLTSAAEKTFKRLKYAATHSTSLISSVDAEVTTFGMDIPLLKGKRSSKIMRAKKAFREGLTSKFVPAITTFAIASQIPTITNLQTIGLSIVTAALTLSADTLVATYRDDEWIWTGVQN